MPSPGYLSDKVARRADARTSSSPCIWTAACPNAHPCFAHGARGMVRHDDDAERTSSCRTACFLAVRSASSCAQPRSEEQTSELQSLMRISYAVFTLQKKTQTNYRSI